MEPGNAPFFSSRPKAISLGIMAGLGCLVLGIVLLPLFPHHGELIRFPGLEAALPPLGLAILLAVLAGRKPGGRPFAVAVLLTAILLPILAFLAILGMCALG
jgi:hypothetical protein